MSARYLVLVVAVAAATASADEPTDSERFQLGNKCGGMDLAIVFDDDARDIGLDEADLRNYTEGRLRGARLFDAEWSDALILRLTVAGGGFALLVEFAKPVLDPYIKERGFAVTYSHGFTGVHGGDGEFILSELRKHVDQFIVDYLRVNADACES